MCVSKTRVAIKQGEFPGGKLLGDTGNRQDAGPHPTHTHTMHFFPSQHSQNIQKLSLLEQLFEMITNLVTIFISQTQNVHKKETILFVWCQIPQNYPYFLDKISPSPLHNCACLSIGMILECYFLLLIKVHKEWGKWRLITLPMTSLPSKANL